MVGLTLLGCEVTVAAGLDESAANEVVTALQHSGVVANKALDERGEGAYQVSVASDEAASAIGILTREGLPPPRTVGVLEAMGDSSLVPSRSAEHAKMLIGIAGELQRSIAEVDGVLSARVHLAVPKRDALGASDEQSAPSASVLVRHRGATPPIAEQQIQRLVAGAVANLAPERVAVVMNPTPASAPAPEMELSRLGPITLTRGSLMPLRAVIGGAVLLNLVLLGLLLLVWKGLRQAKGELSELRQSEGAGDAT